MNTPHIIFILAVFTSVLGAQSAPDPWEALPPDAWNEDAARHLLERAGFGGTAQEIKALAARPIDEAVATLFGTAQTSNASFEADYPRGPRREDLRGKTDDERRKIQQRYRQANDAIVRRFRRWLHVAMVDSKAPLAEKMTLFWQGHFTSGYTDIRNAKHMVQQNALFREHATGSFRLLLQAIARDAAMLEYLDNNRNRRASPNENFAREVMELFTLGIGHYTEQDIIQVARAFTGWDFNRNSGKFLFRAGQHDYGLKTVFGQKGRFDGDDILKIILARPRCAEYLAERLLVFFLCEEPPEELIENLATELRAGDPSKSQYALRPALEKLFKSQAFYSADYRAAKIKSPVELVVGAVRQLQLPARDLEEIMVQMATRCGQTLLQPPNVRGWPGGREWISTSTLSDRFAFAGLVTRDLETESFPAPPPASRPTSGPTSKPTQARPAPTPAPRGPVVNLARRSFPFAVAKYVRAQGLKEPSMIIDHFASFLLSIPLDDDAKRALLAQLNHDLFGKAEPFDLDRWDASRRLKGMVHLMMATPEYQLH